MDQNNDIYSICGRIKNIIAREDIALSPAGTILVNTYALTLLDLYNFAEKLQSPYNEELKSILLSNESLPKYVIELTSPRKNKTLFEQLMEMKAQFPSNKEALKHFTKEYEDLGGDDFWLEAESAEMLDEDYIRIMRLARSIHMCKYLIEKYEK